MTIIAPMKAGKSTIINSIIGQELLPSHSAAMTTLPTAIDRYEQYFGASIDLDEVNQVTFTATDAQRPFLTANNAMWSIFEPQLNKRMKDLTQHATYSEKVRACLMEIMASGQYNVDDVAKDPDGSPQRAWVCSTNHTQGYAIKPQAGLKYLENLTFLFILTIFLYGQ